MLFLDARFMFVWKGCEKSCRVRKANVTGCCFFILETTNERQMDCKEEHDEVNRTTEKNKSVSEQELRADEELLERKTDRQTDRQTTECYSL